VTADAGDTATKAAAVLSASTPRAAEIRRRMGMDT
jgi:hypothetical protein